jgi:hypothetical protein
LDPEFGTIKRRGVLWALCLAALPPSPETTRCTPFSFRSILLRPDEATTPPGGFRDGNAFPTKSRAVYLSGAALQSRPLQLQRQGRSLRGVTGRRRHHHPALLHARRRSHFRRLQNGACFGAETLDVALRGKTITDIRNMSVERRRRVPCLRARCRQEDDAG